MQETGFLPAILFMIALLMPIKKAPTPIGAANLEKVMRIPLVGSKAFLANNTQCILQKHLLEE